MGDAHKDQTASIGLGLVITGATITHGRTTNFSYVTHDKMVLKRFTGKEAGTIRTEVFIALKW